MIEPVSNSPSPRVFGKWLLIGFASLVAVVLMVLYPLLFFLVIVFVVVSLLNWLSDKRRGMKW